MIQKEKHFANGAGAPQARGNGPGGWEKLLQMDSPLMKKEPRAAAVIKPMSRKMMDMLVRQCDTKEGKKKIINLVMKSGATLGKDDVKELSTALINGKSEDFDLFDRENTVCCCRLLGALADKLEQRPDLSEPASVVLTRIRQNMNGSWGTTPLGYEDSASLCKALVAIGKKADSEMVGDVRTIESYDVQSAWTIFLHNIQNVHLIAELSE